MQVSNHIFYYNTCASIINKQLNYKYGVKNTYKIVVFCKMRNQRCNKILVKRIAERLKELRHERGLAQENVRFDMELNIGRIEIGQHSITITTLADLCDYYGVTLEEFFKGIKTK